MPPDFQDAYSVFSGLRFADPQSRENALWALHWAHLAGDNWMHGVSVRPPLVVITGDYEHNQLALARRFMNAARVPVWRPADITPFWLLKLAKEAPPVVIVHEVSELKREQQRMLCAFLQSRCMPGHVAANGRQMSGQRIRLLLVMTTGEKRLDLTKELEACTVRIKLRFENRA